MSLTGNLPTASDSKLLLPSSKNDNSSNNNTVANNNNNNLDDATTLTGTSDSTPVLLLEQLIYVENNFPLSNTDVTSFEEQLNNDLSIFADDSFIFPDDDKPKFERNGDDEGNTIKNHEDQNAAQSNNLFQEFSKFQQTQEVPSPSNNAIISTNVIMTKQEQELQQQQQQQQNDKDIISESLVALLSSQSSNGENVLINTIATTLLTNLPKINVPQGAKLSLSAAGLSDIQIDALAALIYQRQKLNKVGGNSNLSDVLVNSSTGIDLQFWDSINNDFNFGLFTTTGVSPVASTSATTPQDLLSHPHILGTHQRAFSTNSLPTQIASFNSASSASQQLQQSPGSDLSSSYNSFIGPGEEDVKRRRNTAASARFRIKRRMKEQEMERNMRDLNENVKKMRLRIDELESENKVLKSLIISKNSNL